MMNISPGQHDPIDNGFTILELIMVISIISILAVTAYPIFGTLFEFPLDSAVKVVESDINFTQISAMSKGASRSIIFTAGKGEYLYDSAGDGSQTSHRDLKELGSGVTIGSDLVITFNSLGEPAASSAQRVIISAQSANKNVAVEPYTGKTKIE